MKFTPSTIAVALFALSTGVAGAATVSYSTTTTGNRVVLTTSPLTPVLAGSALVMGTMTNEGDFSTFTEFARSTINSNAAFTNGVISGGATNNTATAANFASKSIYIAIYNSVSGVGASAAGLFKSTTVYDAGISASASQSFLVNVSSFTTSITPTLNWAYNAAAINPSGTTGAAGNPATDRTGIVFTLGAAIPEAGTATLGMLAVGMLLARRKR